MNGSEVLMTVLLKTQVFRDVTPYRLLNIYRRFEVSQCLHLQDPAVLGLFELLDPEYEGIMSLRNVCIYLPVDRS